MPLIKFSALVSDMKGKLNGSVFASGTSGTYFRTNPSGGGRKSRIWDQVKARFSSLASQWRNLTSAQQQSWNDATPLYPTTNKFGDPRLPSGYELYMSLNRTMQAAEQPLLSTPLAPRAFPDVVPQALDFPDYKAIIPNRSYDFHTDEGNPAIAYSPTWFDGQSMNFFKTLSCKYHLKPNSGVKPPVNTMICLMLSVRDNNSMFGLFVVYRPTGQMDLTVRYYYPGLVEGDYVISKTFKLLPRTYNPHVILTFNLLDAGSFEVCLDGKHLTGAVEQTNNDKAQFWLYPFIDNATVPGDYQNQANGNGDFALGDSTFTVTNLFDVSDLRYFDSPYTQDIAKPSAIGGLPPHAEWVEAATMLYWAYWSDNYNPGFPATTEPIFARLLRSGYYLETETAVITFTQIDADRFPNEVNFDPLYEMMKIGGPAHDPGNLVETHIYSYWEPWPPGDMNPDYHYPTQDPGMLNVGLMISGAVSVSSGVTNYTGKTRQFAILPLDGKIYDFSSEMFSILGIPAFDSDISLKASFVDLETGQRMKPDWPLTFIPYRLTGSLPSGLKAVVRFKAGSELSGKVN